MRVESAGESSIHLRSEEHTSELQSRLHLVCRLLLEKKKKNRHRVERDSVVHRPGQKLNRNEPAEGIVRRLPYDGELRFEDSNTHTNTCKHRSQHDI